MVFALLGAEGSFGVKGSADRLLPDLLDPRANRACTGSGSRWRSRWRCSWCRPGRGACATPAWCGRTTAAPRSPSRSGRCWRRRRWSTLAPLAFLNDRADLDLLEPELRRWLPYLLGIAFLGFLDDSLGQGSGRRHPARLARPLPGRCAQGTLSTGAIKAIGALALAAYVVSGRGLEDWRYLADVALLILATNLFNLLDLRPGRAEKGLALLGVGLCLGAWTLAPIELLGIFAGPVLVGAWLTLRRAGDARRHRLQPDRRRRRGLAADHSGRRRAPDRPRRWSWR